MIMTNASSMRVKPSSPASRKRRDALGVRQEKKRLAALRGRDTGRLPSGGSGGRAVTGT